MKLSIRYWKKTFCSLGFARKIKRRRSSASSLDFSVLEAKNLLASVGNSDLPEPNLLEPLFALVNSDDGVQEEPVETSGVSNPDTSESTASVPEVRDPFPKDLPGEEPTGEEPTGEEPTGEEPTDEEPTGEEPTNEEPTKGDPAFGGERPTGGGMDPTVGGSDEGDDPYPPTGPTEPNGPTEPSGPTDPGNPPPTGQLNYAPRITSGSHFYVDENVPPGTHVGQIYVFDPNGDAIGFYLTGSSAFEIDYSTGNLYVKEILNNRARF